MIIKGNWYSRPMIIAGDWYRRPMILAGNWYRRPMIIIGNWYRRPMIITGNWYRRPMIITGNWYRRPMIITGNWYRRPMIIIGIRSLIGVEISLKVEEIFRVEIGSVLMYKFLGCGAALADLTDNGGLGVESDEIAYHINAVKKVNGMKLFGDFGNKWLSMDLFRGQNTMILCEGKQRMSVV
ncbi:hypothetical protein BY996DRAFT_8688136 [Phakopsora pachyrhizi]|nr:hypothetical protein BY996DRAFT_8688136 [Phakopsora pachyrhizi]